MISLRIALRYLLSKKSHNAVNILSIISIAGVAVATAAMVIVLSVFNGFSDLAAGKLSQMDPDLLIVPGSGKVIAGADDLAIELSETAGVTLVAPVIDEQALAIAPGGQMPVKLRGMTVEAVNATNLGAIIIDGDDVVGYIDEPGSAFDGEASCVVSVGVAVETGLRGSPDYEVEIYMPQRSRRINVANPMSAFRADTLLVGGVYRVEQAEYDTDMIIVPLEVTRRLLDYDNGQASALQVFVAGGADVDAVRQQLMATLGCEYKVLNRYQQQQGAFNMIAIEKWVTLLMLAFILLITSFNILSAIYILRVEKEGNMAVLEAMGADRHIISRIFAWQTLLITWAGGALGLVLGSALTLLQQYGHIIKLNVSDTAALAVDAYPVRLVGVDLLVVMGVVVGVSLFCTLMVSLSGGGRRR